MEQFRKVPWYRRIVEGVFEIEARIARAWSARAHKRLFWSQWSFSPPPEWFDHHLDLHFQWPVTGNSLWLERGVFGSLALKGGNVLELACGDGFNAKHFYAHRSKSVIACDFDPSAIAHASEVNRASNVTFQISDIRYNMPSGLFENVVWDAAIEHFTPEEIEKLMFDIKSRIAPGGILSGYTIVERADGVKQLSHHEYEFRDKEDLKRFIAPHFKNVKVFETIYPSRHNLYFWASDGVLPFDAKWPSAC